jgi:hypothetical protein
MDSCTACSTARAGRVRLLRVPVDAGGRVDPVGIEPSELPLCASCAAWLWGLVAAARNEDAGLVGAPSLNGRRLVFEDQCRVCRQIPPGPGVHVAMESRLRHLPGWPPMLLCAACDGWLTSLASDGLSARHRSSREVDGPYGAWLYPNLAGVEVVIRVDGQSGRAIHASCAEMGLPVVPSPRGEGQAVLFLEPGDIDGLHACDSTSSAGTVVVASFASEFRLREDLSAGATDWITDPPTPQQVTRAIVHARRFPGHEFARNEESLLPYALDPTAARAALLVRPHSPAPPFETAWLLRRHSRGYDEVASLRSGEIVVFPRVGEGRVDGVMRRLQWLLAGRATVTPLVAGFETRPRFEAAG